MSNENQFGRVDEELNVFVLDGGVERKVGQVPGSTPEAALAIYTTRFADLATAVRILEQRVKSNADAQSIEKAFVKLQADLVEPHAVGDIAALRARVAALEPVIAGLREAKAEAQKEVVAAAIKAREELVVKAEALAAADTSKVIWKTASVELNNLFDAWQAAQKTGARLPKAEADALWKRFSAARTKFESAKRAFFAQADATAKAARSKKQELVAKAEELVKQGAEASLEYRKLVDAWKASGRSSSKADDALWEKFKAAGDAIYAARAEKNAELSVGFEAALKAKLEILADAAKIDPTKDLAEAKRALLEIQKRWEAAGRVAKEKVRELEDKLRAVERRVRDAEAEQWRKSDPSTKARTDSVLAQLEDSIAKLKVELEAAKKSKDAKKIADAEAALAAREAWLKVVAG